MNPKLISRIISTILLSVVLLFVCLATLFLLYFNQPKETAVTSTNAQVAVVKELTDEQKHGQEVFTNNCASCHNITDEVAVGPGLKGITQRRPVEWIVTWVKNPQKVIASGDKYAVDLYNKFNKTQMTAFPNLKEEDIKAILSYIDSGN